MCSIVRLDHRHLKEKVDLVFWINAMDAKVAHGVFLKLVLNTEKGALKAS